MKLIKGIYTLFNYNKWNDLSFKKGDSNEKIYYNDNNNFSIKYETTS